MKLPDCLTVLGIASDLCVETDERPYDTVFLEPDTLLCSSPDGRTMYLLRPDGMSAAGDDPLRARNPIAAAAAMELREAFTDRRGSGYLLGNVPPLAKPKLVGRLVIITYIEAKGDDDEPAEWRHYFEIPGARPAYPELYDLGRSQYLIAPGEWAVKPEGIAHARPPRKRRNHT